MKQFRDYPENNYGRRPRLTNDKYRRDLVSWQVPAIQTHFGSLKGKTFLDIGAGDIVLGEMQDDLGRPKTFYAQDLSEISLVSGVERLEAAGIDTSNITPLVSDNFDFGKIRAKSVDFAFSNSLFSHLSLNSILQCLRNLAPKMKKGARYCSSMIVVPTKTEPDSYDWSKDTNGKARIVSRIARDPFHYTEGTIKRLSDHDVGFEVKAIHDYGHPFQKLVEFTAAR